MSKSKTTRFQVHGGIDLGFIQKQYTDEFPEYFDRWINSVVKDPKSFNFVTKPLTHLLRLSAFDFFPECAITCAIQTDPDTAICEVKYKNDGGESSGEVMTMKCKEFDRISKELDRKANVLEDSINLYRV